MNQRNRENFSLKNKKQLTEKINSLYKRQNWLRLSGSNRFGYFTAIALILTLLIKFMSPGELAVSQPILNFEEAQTNKTLILAQEEKEVSEEEASEEEVSGEEFSGEEFSEEEVSGEEVSGEEFSEEEFSEEEASEEEVSEEEASEEEASEEEVSEEEFFLEKEKEALEEEIDERIEEWESQKRGSEISHSFSAILTILLTIAITLLGTGLFEIPYGRLVLLIFGIIAVLIQLNSSIFLLEKSMGGYRILVEQGATLKNKLEYVRTEEQLAEVREHFQEVVLEALDLE